MTSTAIRLAEIEARANEATPGPWRTDAPEVYIWGPDNQMIADRFGDAGAIRGRGTGARLPTADNLAFIAAARTDVPWLVDELRAALDQKTAAEKACDAAVATLTDLEAEHETALARAEKAEAALLRYGQHEHKCQELSLSSGECWCGFDALRNAVATKGDDHE